MTKYKFVPDKEETFIEALNRLTKEIRERQIKIVKEKQNAEEKCYRVLEALTDAYIYLNRMNVDKDYIFEIYAEIYTVAKFLLREVLQFEGAGNYIIINKEDK